LSRLGRLKEVFDGDLSPTQLPIATIWLTMIMFMIQFFEI